MTLSNEQLTFRNLSARYTYRNTLRIFREITKKTNIPCNQYTIGKPMTKADFLKFYYYH